MKTRAVQGLAVSDRTHEGLDATALLSTPTAHTCALPTEIAGIARTPSHGAASAPSSLERACPGTKSAGSATIGTRTEDRTDRRGRARGCCTSSTRCKRCSRQVCGAFTIETGGVGHDLPLVHRPPLYVAWLAVQAGLRHPRLDGMARLTALWGARLTYNFAQGRLPPGLRGLPLVATGLERSRASLLKNALDGQHPHKRFTVLHYLITNHDSSARDEPRKAWVTRRNQIVYVFRPWQLRRWIAQFVQNAGDRSAFGSSGRCVGSRAVWKCLG
jgi:hypothetical protein